MVKRDPEMIKTVKDYINKYDMIHPSDEIIAGISGGADSVCMFLQLIEYRKTCDYDLKVVHINHKIREEAGEDATFVKDLCKKYGVDFYLFEEDVEKIASDKGISTEEAGRLIRYERFRQVMSKAGAKIAVAHNRNDVAETVLFNIFRGTGLEGLASLTPVNGDIIRPLLGLTREEIEAYLDENHQSYKTDSTNQGCDYARNRIRNIILPYAKEHISEKSTEHIAELSQKMLMLREYVRNETEKAYKITVSETENETKVDLKAFYDLEPMLKNEVILLILEKMTPHRKDITGMHVKAILDIVGKDGEKRVDLPYELEAVKQYDVLTIRKTDSKIHKAYEYDLKDDTDITLPDGRTVRVRVFDRDINACIEQKTYTKWFDYDKIINCVKLRNRMSGDYITINSDMERKSLKDYLIDCKIPREQRDLVPVVADGSHILWVIGYRISEYYKISETTVKIMEISVV